MNEPSDKKPEQSPLDTPLESPPPEASSSPTSPPPVEGGSPNQRGGRGGRDDRGGGRRGGSGGGGGGRGRPPRPERKPTYEEARPHFAPPNLRELDKDIEDELAAAMDGFDDKNIDSVNKAQQSTPASNDPNKKGKILSIHGPDVFIDVPGGRSQGFMSAQQFPEGVPPVGTEIEFTIDGYDRANGLLKLARIGAAQVIDWSSVALGVTVEARVIETNRGGLAVDVNGIRGFVPFREIDIYRIEKPEELVNQRLVCEVIEVQPSEKNLVLSRRKLLERERERQREEFWKALEVGQIREGTVRSIQPFGVFVDLGGADGLIPMGELSWQRVEKAEDIVKLNQKVQVKVMRVEPDAKRISLSLRQMAKSPWDTLSERVHVGSRVHGKVTRIAEFGAFVEIEPGIEGMIHISELGTNRVRRVLEVVQVGKEVEAVILAIDPAARRMSLSLRAILVAKQKAEEEAAIAEMKARQAAEEAADADAEANAPPPRPEPKRNFDLKGGLGSGS